MSFRTTLSYLFFPLTMWYPIGVAFRNSLYDLGIKKQRILPVTTIGIGNLNTGGSGKTPMADYLLRLLSSSYPTALLSRGYRRHSSGFLLDDGTHSPRLLGDEPAMLAAKHPDVQVAVCEKRVVGAAKLLSSENPPQLIVLDDVYQHRQLKPNINILLTDFHRPFFDDKILPYGNLREFKSGKNRASIVIVTKCPEKLNPIDKNNIIQDLHLQNFQKVFFSYLKYSPLENLHGAPVLNDLSSFDAILAVTGIANPEPLIQHLSQNRKVQHLRFKDHHEFSKRDVEKIKSAFESMSGKHKAIVTTEKDAVRLRPLAEELNILVQPVSVAFHNDGEDTFDSFVRSATSENISFLSKLSIYR